jgi:hypothetical protein
LDPRRGQAGTFGEKPGDLVDMAAANGQQQRLRDRIVVRE